MKAKRRPARAQPELTREGWKLVSSRVTVKHKLSQVGEACEKLLSNPKANPVNELEKQVLGELVGMGLAKPERFGFPVKATD